MDYQKVLSAIFSPRALMLVVGAILICEGFRAVKERSAGMLNLMTLAENTYGKWAVVYGWFFLILGGLLVITAVFSGNAENTAVWRVLESMG